MIDAWDAFILQGDSPLKATLTHGHPELTSYGLLPASTRGENSFSSGYSDALFFSLQSRFLSGEDGGADADNDASLDDDWAKQQNQDLEDQYFDS